MPRALRRESLVIEVRNLKKSYGSHHAVRGLTFEVPKGQVCGFLGPNGAGKSTTLRMITGFLSPSGGSIRIGGVDALDEPLKAKRQIGYMPEASPLYPEMRVEEYLYYRAELKKVPASVIDRRVDAALEQADVEDVAERIIGQLSKGYRQRVGLADALVADPPLLILDEPTAGLDPNQIRQVRGLIGRLAEKKTVLLSTHILPEVEAICDRVLIIHKGQLVSEGDPKELRRGERELIRIEGKGTKGEFAAALEDVGGIEVVNLSAASGGLVKGKLRTSLGAEGAEKIFRAVADAGLSLRELRRQQASLEDVFANLTTAEPVPAAAEEEE